MTGIICKGDLLLGSGCGECSNCREQLVTIGRNALDEMRDGAAPYLSITTRLLRQMPLPPEANRG